MKALRSQTLLVGVLLFFALLLAPFGYGCTQQQQPGAPLARSLLTSATANTKPEPTAPELAAPQSDDCPAPLFLDHVTATAGPAIVAEAQSGPFKLVVTRIDAANSFQLRPQARRARFRLELKRDEKVLREFVVGNDADPGSPPSLAAGLDGEFFVAWPDRSKNAPGVGVSGGNSYTVLDEERFARITPNTERLDSVLVVEKASLSEDAAVPKSDPLFPERRYFNLRLAFWDGRFRALTDDRRGLTLWQVNALGQLDSPRRLDAEGHYPQVAVSLNGQFGVIYLRNRRQGSASNWLPPALVFLELREGTVFGASFETPDSFFPLALASEPAGWWLMGSHAAEWPKEDYRHLYESQEPARAGFLRFSSVNGTVAVPVEELPPSLEHDALSTRLARVWELDAVRVEGPGEFAGTFSREEDRFEFRVSARCQVPRAASCEGHVVSRAIGGVGNIPLQGGAIRVRYADSEFQLERVDASGNVLWSLTVDSVEDLRLSRDGSRLFAVRSYGWVKAFSTSDGSELFSVRRRGSGPCLTETEQGLVVGYHDQDSYTFELLDENGAATPVLELRGQYYQCAIAPWSRGILVATVYDNEPGANLGERVRKYERMNPQYWTRIAPYSMQGKLLGVPDAMPGGLPVAWRESVVAQGTHFVTALGTRNFVWHWSDQGRASGKPAVVHLLYNDAPTSSKFAPPGASMLSWDMWRGDDRACD